MPKRRLLKHYAYIDLYTTISCNGGHVVPSLISNGSITLENIEIAQTREEY